MNTNVITQMRSEPLSISNQICRVIEFFSKLSVALRMLGKVLIKRIEQDLAHANEIERSLQQAHQDRLRISASVYRNF
jgi:hypothetical protein